MEFASEQISRGLRIEKAKCGPFSGFSTVYSKSGSFWKEWWLRAGNLMIYVTYNVSEGSEGVEEDHVKRMLESLSAVSS
jgi:hypothetical protein